MFKLQRLEITGFKSFADYTEIVFTDNGITAVVGPNGCGKSNLNDAMSWVLGEQRAKSLRGEEMKDVIFQGTGKRSAGGMAEVILHLVRDEDVFDSNEEDELIEIDAKLSEIDENTLEVTEVTETIQEPDSTQEFETTQTLSTQHSALSTNSSTVGVGENIQITKAKRHWKPRSFALEFMPGEAVSVGRRLYLSGESEYLLNGKSCRLRDIQDLFAGTGLSGAHYAIIEQGRIGQILSAKPSERRNLIEEAAGISKFRTRQRATEARLESAKSNLSRISDIVSEIEKHANSLRRQASKTKRYKVLREDLRVLLRQIYAIEGANLGGLIEELEEKLEAATKLEREIYRATAEKEEAFRDATNAAREAEELLAEMREKHSQNALERDRNQRELQYQKEQIINLGQRHAVLKNEIENAESRVKLFSEEFERLSAEEKKEREAAGKNELALREAETKYREKVAELNKIESELDTTRTDLMQHTAAVERFGEIQRSLDNTLARLRERLEGLQRESKRAEENFLEHERDAAELEKQLAEEREKLKELQDEKSQIIQEIGTAREIWQREENALKQIRDEFSKKKNRLETLRELDEKRAVYAPSVQKLFAEQTKIGVNFLGTLADVLNVEMRAETAVETIFGNYLQAVLVENETDAKKVFDYLTANKLGRIAVLVGSKFKVQSSKSENLKPEISQLLGTSGEVIETLKNVFPIEMSAKFVKDFEQAKAGEVLVDADGNLAVGKKFLVGGKHVAGEKNKSLLAFKRELRGLETDTEKLSKEIEIAETKTEKAKKKLSVAEEKLVDLQALIVKIERTILSQEIQSKSLKQEIERSIRHKRVVGEETAQIGRELKENELKKTSAAENAANAESARKDADAKLSGIVEKINAARQKVEAENAVLNEKKTLAATSEERRRSAENARRRVGNEQTEFESRISRLNLEIVEIEGKSRGITENVEKLKELIEIAETEKTVEQNELETAKENLTNTRESADKFSVELADLNKKSAEARNERAALEIRKSESMERLRNINENCVRDLNVSLVKLVDEVETSEDFDLQMARTESETLRDKLENFGAINMLAMEELEEVEERFTFLTSQRQDILDGIAAAEAALKEIKQRSREKFREAFKAINENFSEFFTELFGGGNGAMTLLEADDVLEAGIEIVAQPPGKRLQNLLLLSGGEKTMTAIALVLAIFRYRPAPFCLLDEVDAPLDESNVGRFVDKVAEMSANTQFIVITHNKRTMEAARALYGVTMEEAGVSKVVSVKFE